MNELNEQEMEQLERELRSYGQPYGSPEPDERYFANFRARVMERIAAEPAPSGFGARISEFFGSPLRMTLLGGGMLAAILAYFYLQSSPESPVVKNVEHQELVAPPAQHLGIAPETTAPLQTTPPAEPSKSVKQAVLNQTQEVQPAPTPRLQEQTAEHVQNVVQAASEFEHMDELSVSDDTEPVSYDKLSMDELEAVLKTLESEPLTIQ